MSGSLTGGNRRLDSVRRDGLEELRRYLESFWSDVLNAYSAEIALGDVAKMVQGGYRQAWS